MKKLVENKTGQTVNQLIDDLKNEDIRKRQISVANLPVIASALGPERTRLELIPFLNELMDDEEEVLTSLVEVLSNFLDFIGGPQHAQILFGPMEYLCKSDEQSVREKASCCIKKLIGFIDIKKNEDVLMNLVKRLRDSDQYFAKGPACDIIPSFYAQITAQAQLELNNCYLNLSKDEIPIIRKQSSINLSDLIKVSCPKNEDFILQILNNLIKDEQDLIRIYLVDACVQYLKVEPKLKNSQSVLQSLKSLSEDRSWRIKYYFCDKLGEVVKTIGKNEFKKMFFQNYISYLEDGEPELRAISAGRLDIVGGNVEVDDIINKIIPLVKKLQNDSQNYVRNSLASSFLGLSQFLGKTNTNELILPVFLQLLKDEDSDVRINLFKQLNQITNVLGIDMLSQSVIPALTDLAQDKIGEQDSLQLKSFPFSQKKLDKNFQMKKFLKYQWIGCRIKFLQQENKQFKQQNQLFNIWAHNGLKKILWQKFQIYQINQIIYIEKQLYLQQYKFVNNLTKIIQTKQFYPFQLSLVKIMCPILDSMQLNLQKYQDPRLEIRIMLKKYLQLCVKIVIK
ncbi:hypothetical protein IMG5_159380, partial [Ichthyophthirius multifiliis]